MANEINAFITSGYTHYAVIRNVAGQVWYPLGQTFEAWGTGGRTVADYDIALTDKSGGMYVGDFDSNVSAGYYWLVIHQQAGGSPADSDQAYWREFGYWDGTNWKRAACKGDEMNLADNAIAEAKYADDMAMEDIAAGAPSATCTWRKALNYIFMAWRNKMTSTSSKITVYKDDATTPLCESNHSDDDTTYSRGEFGAPN